MLDKKPPMTHRLPALVVPESMYDQLNQLSERTGLTMSEVVRQGLAFFLSHIDSQTNVEESEDSSK